MGPGADHDHRRLGVVAVTQIGEDFETAAAWQHQVEHDQIGSYLARELESARAVRRLEEAVALAERGAAPVRTWRNPLPDSSCERNPGTYTGRPCERTARLRTSGRW